LLGNVKPSGFGDLHLPNGFLGAGAERGTVSEIGDIGYVATIVIAIENVDMVVFHGSSPNSKLYSSKSLPPDNAFCKSFRLFIVVFRIHNPCSAKPSKS
jgi:hypothetical protein